MIILGIGAFVVLVALLDEGDIGATITWVVIIALVIGLIAAGGTTSRAYNNAVDYWAKGGPDRDRK